VKIDVIKYRSGMRSEIEILSLFWGVWFRSRSPLILSSLSSSSNWEIHMPTVGVSRDRLFEALGKTYCEFKKKKKRKPQRRRNSSSSSSKNGARMEQVMVHRRRIGPGNGNGLDFTA